MIESDDRIFEIGLSVADKIRARLAEATISRSDLEKVWPLIYFFGRAYKSYVALRLLWIGGYVEDAHTLARTIYELCLQADFFAGDIENRSIQFTENLFATALEYYRRLNPEQSEQGKAMAEELAQLRKEFRISKGLSDEPAKYQVNWWGGGGVKGLVKKLGLPLRIEYETIYFILSDHAHSSVSLAYRYAVRNENSLTLNCGPERSHEITVPYSTTGWLLRIGSRVSEVLSLGLKNELEKAAVKLNLVARPEAEVGAIRAKS